VIRRFLHALALTVAFPCLVGIVVYYGFGTNYTGGVFHEAGFRSQYESGVYKYRILGRYLLLKTYHFVKSQCAPAGPAGGVLSQPPASAEAADRKIDAAFYTAYFLQNTFFMVIACILLYFVLAGSATPRDSTGPTMVAGLLMGLTQYVVSPYDTLSYALLLMSFLLISRPFRFSFPLLVLAVVTGTLAKETSALALAFFFAIHHSDLLKFRRRETLQLAVLVVAFVSTYTLLRVILGQNNREVWECVTLGLNLRDPFSWIGIAAMPIVSYLLCAGSRNLKRCLFFLAASSPYILIMPVIALGWEMRLWVPVWLGLICLAGSLPGGSSGTAGGANLPEHARACR
jgi:hypothetical protein